MTGLWRIYKTGFEAAHHIKGHPKCGRTHGHSYKLNVFVRGFAEEWVDFKDIKKTVDSFINTIYDHRDLGNMTAEAIALDIVRYFQKFKWEGYIELYETAKFGIMMFIQNDTSD